MCGDRWLQDLTGPVPRNYRQAYQRACERMAGRDPRIDAEKAAVRFEDLGGGRGRFVIPVLNRTYEVDWPGLAIREVGGDAPPSIVLQILLLHYLMTADGIALRGQWASFRDLPDGRTYYPAFRSGSEERLLQRFGNDAAALRAAAGVLGGQPLPLGDHAYVFNVLPRLPLAVLLWEGDEDFAPELHLLLDASAGNYLPTEDLAVIARYLAACLLRSAPAAS